MTVGNGIAVAAVAIAGAYVMVNHNAEAGGALLVATLFAWALCNFGDK